MTCPFVSPKAAVPPTGLPYNPQCPQASQRSSPSLLPEPEHRILPTRGVTLNVEQPETKTGDR